MPWTLMKTMIRISVDNYVLPGTATGTEILWLYLIQWKRDIFAVTFIMFYSISSQLEFMASRK